MIPFPVSLNYIIERTGRANIENIILINRRINNIDYFPVFSTTQRKKIAMKRDDI